MALCEPEHEPIVEAAAAEFLKLCRQRGIKTEQIMQTAIAVMAAAIAEEAGGDLKYAMDLTERFLRTLKSAVKVQHDSSDR